MRNLWKSVLGLCVIGMWFGAGAPAQAASGVGPYYATPSWDQTLPAATRFIVLTNMASQAVLDRETGLVWEQSPDAITDSWFLANILCNRKTVGGRKGWRLPTVQDLASLIDTTVAFPGPTLPPGHPFSNVQTSTITFLSKYWSATTFTNELPGAWVVSFVFGNLDPELKASNNHVWCVRGGQGVDSQ